MTPAIRLQPQEDTEPCNSRIPYHRAIHWRPKSPIASVGKPAVSVFVTQKAFVRFCAHASSDLENEVGGWLLGKLRMDKDRGEQFIVIDTILPASHTQQGSAFLTFTQDSLVELHRHVQENYPEKDILGWFHTHPRMGVFLSSYDTFLHNNFFPEMWQVALVIEPFSRSGGFFIRQQDGMLDPRQYFGFQELINGNMRSVVHWQNVTSRRLPKNRS
jgi:proteasome lid subunit RPN8/RPN11